MRVLSALCLIVALSAPFAAPTEAAVKVRYYNGQPTYVSAKAASAVQILMPEPSKARRVSLAVVALNRSGVSQTLGYENVALRTSTGAPVQLITFEELKHKAKVRAGWATVLAAVAGGVNGYVAQRSAYSSTHGQVSTSTPRGRITTTYSARTYNPAAAQIGQTAAAVETVALMSTVSAGLDATLARLGDTVLRTTTVDPSQSFGGMIVFDLPKGVALRDLIATVRFAGEVHDISLAGTTGPLDQGAEVDIDAPAGSLPVRAGPAPFAPPSPSYAQWRSQEVAYAAQTSSPPTAIVCRNYLIRMASDPSQNVCAD